MMAVDDLDTKRGTTMEVGPEPGADKDDAPAEPTRAAAPVDVGKVLLGAVHTACLVGFAVLLPFLAYLCAQTALGKGSEQNIGMRLCWGMSSFGLLLMGVAATHPLVGNVVAAVPVDVEKSSAADAEEMVVRAWDPAVTWAMVTWAIVVLGGAWCVFSVVTLPWTFRACAQAALDKDFGAADERAGVGFFGVYMFLSWVGALYTLVGTVVSLLWRCAVGKWQGIGDFLRRGTSHVWDVWGYIFYVMLQIGFINASVVAALV